MSDDHQQKLDYLSQIFSVFLACIRLLFIEKKNTYVLSEFYLFSSSFISQFNIQKEKEIYVRKNWMEHCEQCAKLVWIHS